VVLAKVAASGAVWLGGFRAVSDDDFSRTVIAEQWARAPRLDPTGTSWLPFPFWVTGAAMKLAGRGIDTARASAALLGVAAALLVYVAARWLGASRVAATGGAVAAAVFPWSARLGVATVPELPTAALTVAAMAALAPPVDLRRRILGGAALLAATLSRYEAWPVALAFAAFCVLDAREREQGKLLLVAAALAVAGPVAWMAWNQAAHDDALHFWARVSSYRQALGTGAEGGVASRLWAYPVAMVREEPEVVALFVAGAAALALRHGLSALRARLAPQARPAAVALVQIAALSLALVKDGAPTHHPERALLAALILVALAGASLAVEALSPGVDAPRSARLLRNAMSVALAFVPVAGLIRAGRPPWDLARREGEEAMGRAAARAARPGEPILIEVADYGYLAAMAALGRPEDAIADRSVDPREARVASSFADAEVLRRKSAASGARWAVARDGEPARAALGSPVTEQGGWALFRVAPAPPPPVGR
jgi:hypothetical protein